MASEVGARGEQVAAEYLQRLGYRILQTNYRTRYGEIDLVCQHDGDLVFVEVKARTSYRYGRPEEAITAGKRQRLKLAAALYLQEHAARWRRLRLEMVAVDLTPGLLAVSAIRHYPELA